MSKPAVICVDDERIVLEALKSQLKNHFGRKFNIYITESAEEARELIEEILEEGESVHCVVSDAIMPGESGPNFLMDLHGSHPEIIKILLTGQVGVRCSSGISLRCPDSTYEQTLAGR